MIAERVLAVDIGAGTQDILLYEPGLPLENCFKLVLPSPTTIVAARIRRATRAGRPVSLVGHVMGGGRCAWALQEHLAAGLAAHATPAAALTFHDDLSRVRAMGVIVGGTSPPDAVTIELHDLDLPALRQALALFEVELPSRCAVAVQDHGFSPDRSNRQARSEHWQAFMAAGGRVTGLVYRDIPARLTRMAAVRDDCPGAVLMDTGPAAAWGALADEPVAAHRTAGLVVVNVGNAHTLGLLVRGEHILGLFEQHTGSMTRDKLADYVARLRAGTLTHAEVYGDGGHGCAYAPDFPGGGFEFIAVTGPLRGMADGLGFYPAAPHGDMMLTGCFGLIAALEATE